MVSFNSILLASLLSIASADLSSDLKDVASNASNLDGQVKGWKSSDGLQGALGIQNSYDPLSKAVGNLNNDAGSASKDDVNKNLDGINSLTSAVATLLNDLTSKANDFNAVGAKDIVKGDIDGLSQTSADIISKLLSVDNDDNDKNSVKDGVNSLGQAFTSAISAFGAKSVSFPSI